MNRRSFLKALLGGAAVAVVGVPLPKLVDKFAGTTATAYDGKPLTLDDIFAAIESLRNTRPVRRQVAFMSKRGMANLRRSLHDQEAFGIPVAESDAVAPGEVLLMESPVDRLTRLVNASAMEMRRG